MPLLNLMPRSSKELDSKLLKKTSTKVIPPTIKGGNGILDKINSINALVATKLGKYKDKYEIVRDETTLTEFIGLCIKNGICAIDTETTSLEPITTTIAGVCMYTPSYKAIYIPINHVSYITNNLCANQLSGEFVGKTLSRLQNTKIIMHNAKFDIRVIKNQLGVSLNCYWDTMLASKCLNENESAGLKDLHLKYCHTEDTESLTYEKLFEGLEFTKVPIETAYLYASGDAIKTFELYEFQLEHMQKPHLQKVYNMFQTIEMKVLPIVVDMEETGVHIDLELAKELSVKYHKILDEREQRFYDTLKDYQTEIDAYKADNPNHKLTDPINISSPTQIAILLYDILKLDSGDKKNPRGTGVEILTQLNHPLSKVILDYRETSKLLTTYIDKLPESLNPKTHKIHCSFNQAGTYTGRFSSSDPNLQNIPSHNKEIRKMFVAGEGNVFISADYSQQEPRCLAELSHDEHMINAYKEGKDIYAWIASFIYQVSYEQCLEFNPDGSKNPEGNERRKSVKSIILGLMYGRSTKSIAEQLGISVKKAQDITNKFFTSFPKIKEFMDKTETHARDYGFVETVWGRKRRLPNMMLPEYELTRTSQSSFDPLDFEGDADLSVSDEEYWYFTTKLKKAFYFRDKQAIKEEARQRGIVIKDNTNTIAEATRQCVNSVIQGSSAEITKKAMISVGNDPQMIAWGAKIVLQIHDELIVECPKEFSEECANRLSLLMREAPKDRISVPMKCDTVIMRCWYEKE